MKAFLRDGGAVQDQLSLREQALAFLQLFLYSCRLSGMHVSDGPMHVLNKYRVRFSAVLKRLS